MPLIEARRSLNRMNDQRISYGAEDKYSLVQQSCVNTVITLIKRKTGPIHLVLVGIMAGWQADKIGMSCKIFKILYKFNHHLDS